jgi:hypothetical protein
MGNLKGNKCLSLPKQLRHLEHACDKSQRGDEYVVPSEGKSLE